MMRCNRKVSFLLLLLVLTVKIKKIMKNVLFLSDIHKVTKTKELVVVCDCLGGNTLC